MTSVANHYVVYYNLSCSKGEWHAAVGKNLRDFARYGSIGISWVLRSFLYLYLGYKGGSWLDNHWEIESLFTLFGLLGGFGLSLYSLIQELLMIERRWRREENDGE